MVRIALLVVAFVASCGGKANPESSDGDGWHRISVPIGNGSDEMWIYAASGGSSGPLPVVIYGHGQGLQTVANCWPNGQPESPVVPSSVKFVDALAANGYLGIAIFFRNVGDGSPGPGALKPRDGYLYDTLAYLAAAQWARHQHGAGSERVALVGSSFGTYSAMWAIANHPQLTAAREGLDITSIVLAGHTANPMASSRMRELLTSPEMMDRAAGLFLLSSVLSISAAALADEPVLTSTSLAATSSKFLTAKGIRLVDRMLISPASSTLPECAGMTTVPLCNPNCRDATYRDVLSPATDLGELMDWVSADAVDALVNYNPASGDPGATNPNSVLTLMRALTPVFAAAGPAATRRALLLFSDGDLEITSQLPHGPVLLKAKLDQLGIAWTAPLLASDANGTCGHEHYVDPDRACGFSRMLDEFAAAFGSSPRIGRDLAP